MCSCKVVQLLVPSQHNYLPHNLRESRSAPAGLHQPPPTARHCSSTTSMTTTVQHHRSTPKHPINTTTCPTPSESHASTATACTSRVAANSARMFHHHQRDTNQTKSVSCTVPPPQHHQPNKHYGARDRATVHLAVGGGGAGVALRGRRGAEVGVEGGERHPGQEGRLRRREGQGATPHPGSDPARFRIPAVPAHPKRESCTVEVRVTPGV